MNILLINPRSKIFSYKVPPLGILYIASMLRKKGLFNIFVTDADAEQADFIKDVLHRINPSIVGITAMAFTYRDALGILKLVKRIIPSTFTVIGGIHPTNLPENCIKEEVCDCVVVGEGEITFTELCEVIQSKRTLNEVEGIVFKRNGNPIKTRPRKLITNLDDILFPAYDLIDVSQYTVSLHHTLITSAKTEELILPIVGSRGCHYRCIFCNLDVWDNCLRMRTPGNIVSEIKYLIRNYNVHRFHFLDGLFTADFKRTRQLCNTIINEGIQIKWFCGTRPDLIDPETLTLMKDAGCELIFYGVESGSQLILDNLNKKISVSKIKKSLSLTKEAGIKSFGNFIIGAPGDNRTTINKTISFARKYLDIASFTAAILFPKTSLADLVEKQAKKEIFNKWNNFSFRDISKIVYIPQGLNYCLLKYYIWKAYFIFYINPKVISKFLYKIFTSRKILFYLKHILLNIKSLTVTLAYKHTNGCKASEIL